MDNHQVGDVVVRKSYGSDILFRISGVIKAENGTNRYILEGLEYRLEADAHSKDLMHLSAREVRLRRQRYINAFRRKPMGFPYLLRGITNMSRIKGRPGRILHVDASQQFLNDSISYYKNIGLRPVGVFGDEPDQPHMVRRLLEKYEPDIVVLTGHDGIRKGATDIKSFESYKNSRYYANAVREARSIESDPNRLCIFAGACQSYYEAIMSAGANFASSPGRVIIHSLDPVIVAQRVATTDSRKIITPSQAVRGTVSGEKGIGGINTHGHLAY